MISHHHNQEYCSLHHTLRCVGLQLPSISSHYGWTWLSYRVLHMGVRTNPTSEHLMELIITLFTLGLDLRFCVHKSHLIPYSQNTQIQFELEKPNSGFGEGANLTGNQLCNNWQFQECVLWSCYNKAVCHNMAHKGNALLGIRRDVPRNYESGVRKPNALKMKRSSCDEVLIPKYKLLGDKCLNYSKFRCGRVIMASWTECAEAETGANVL